MSIRAAQFWADYVWSRGVRRVFGLPGTESLELVEAVRRAEVEFVTTHHEATASFLAAMTGHLTGVPGVCVATRGPGATNLVSGVAAAHLDRMPFVAVTGDHAAGPNLPTHQRLPLAEFFAPITRTSVRVTAESLPEQLPRIFDATLGDLPGPAFMSFPATETNKMIADHPPVSSRELTIPAGVIPDLGPVFDAIARSNRLMIIAGLGIPTASAGSQLVALAEQLGCPVADTPQMKGWFPNDHRLYVGTFGTHRDQSVVDLANQSDLILTIGLDSVEFLKPWQLTPPVISLSSTIPDSAIPSGIAVQGSLCRMLEALALDAKPASTWAPETAQRRRTEITAGLIPPHSTTTADRMWPQTVVAALQTAMPPDGVVTVDVGSHKLLMVLQWVARHPQSFLNSSGLSSMGTGIPFAIAAKLIWPNRAVSAVIGDGGYLMYTGQLELLARLDVPIVVVVMNDASFYSIKIKQLRQQYPPVGTDFNNVPIAAVARDFGVRGETVTNLADCERVMSAAFRTDRPTIIEALIDPTGYDFSQ